MAKWVVQGDDASSIAPDSNSYAPGGMPKWNPPKAPNGNDGGALWWDHDDPGGDGHQGEDGLGGGPGQDGFNGGNTPQGVKLIIPSDVSGTVTLVLAGGHGQPGGQGGKVAWAAWAAKVRMVEMVMMSSRLVTAEKAALAGQVASGGEVATEAQPTTWM
ncbi:hypothetical protein [Collimonas silvisoli]|uniref:hypothetical protein n=1 Tax=Collimonas silvisoli TaxID=2825884 RepID=UPI001B8B7C3D|nr:hypothetical protein [Collimonas silvisoli]